MPETLLGPSVRLPSDLTEQKSRGSSTLNAIAQYLSRPNSPCVIMGGDTSTRSEWLKRRQQGLGGSDMAAVMGLDDWRTPWDVWNEKLSQSTDDLAGPDILRGRSLEPFAIQEFARAKNVYVESLPMLQSTRAPWMLANLDAGFMAHDAVPSSSTVSAFECKCPRLSTLLRYRQKGLPPRYIIQLQEYLGVTGLEKGTFGLFHPDDWRVMHFEVERDEKIIEEIFMVGEQFWNEHVLLKKPPAMIPSKIKMPELTEAEKKSVKPLEGEAARVAVERFAEARELVTAAEEVRDEAKKKLIEVMGDATIAEGFGWKFHYRMMNGKLGFNADLCKKGKFLDAARVRPALDDLLGLDLAPSARDAIAIFIESAAAVDFNQAPYTKRGDPFPQFNPYPMKRPEDY